jgi:hypothetical protein
MNSSTSILSGIYISYSRTTPGVCINAPKATACGSVIWRSRAALLKNTSLMKKQFLFSLCLIKSDLRHPGSFLVSMIPAQAILWNSATLSSLTVNLKTTCWRSLYAGMSIVSVFILFYL